MNQQKHHAEMMKWFHILLGVLLGLGASGVSVIGGWLI